MDENRTGGTQIGVLLGSVVGLLIAVAALVSHKAVLALSTAMFLAPLYLFGLPGYLQGGDKKRCLIVACGVALIVSWSAFLLFAN